MTPHKRSASLVEERLWHPPQLPAAPWKSERSGDVLLSTFIIPLIRTALVDFRRDKCTLLAAGISYYVLLSLFPLAIFAVSVLGFALQDDVRRAQFIDDVIQALPLDAIEPQDVAGGGPEVQTELERSLRAAMNGVRGFSVVGLAGLAGTLWAASGMFGALRSAFDRAWNVEEPRRNFLRSKLVDIAMLAVIGVLLLISIALTAVLSIARNVSDFGFLTSQLAVLWQLAGIGVSMAFTFAALMALYRFVPDSSEPIWRTVWPGAALGAVSQEVLKFGFSVYVENLGDYNQVYGTLGTVVLFLFWSWLAAAVVLFGAEINAEYGRMRLERGRRLPASAIAGRSWFQASPGSRRRGKTRP